MNEIASRIDHTLLKPEAGAADVQRMAEEAIQYGFASVCVNGRFAAELAKRLKGTPVRTCVVVDFPLGAMRPTAKAVEATTACKDGADEIDFVAHLPNLLACDVEAARDDFLQVTRNARSVNPEVVIKVILETACLVREVDEATAARRIEAGCQTARESGCDFVKTSTGFHPAGGATPEAVRLLARFAGGLQVKAAGGIRSREDAHQMLEAGATRLGCSAGVSIARGTDAQSSY